MFETKNNLFPNANLVQGWDILSEVLPEVNKQNGSVISNAFFSKRILTLIAEI